MKRIWTRALAFTLSAAFAAVSLTGMLPAKAVQAKEAADGVQAQIYVSADGKDTNDGSQTSPFATIERARQEVARINDNMTGDIIVNIAAGDYYLDETLVFDEADSGTNGFEVIYRSADGIGKADIIGGERITNWIPTTESDVEYDLDPALVGKVYKAQLDPEKYDFNTFYVNDQRAIMARTRNRDNHPNFPMAKGEYMRSAGGSNINRDMRVNLSDIDPRAIAGMKNAQARGEKEIAQVLVWNGGSWDWFTDTLPVVGIDGNQIKFPEDPEHPEKYTTLYDIQSDARYFLQGNLSFMDVEGEYHYNKATGVLYYYPKAEDGAIETQTLVVPTMQKALYFKGAEKADPADQPDPEKQVHNITIDGLEVKDTEYAEYYSYALGLNDSSLKLPPPKEAMESTNPTYCTAMDRPEFLVGTITLTGAHDITITNTRVKNSGMYGIIYLGDNQYNTLTNSVVENSGYGGLIFQGGYPGVGKYNNHNTVENVLIHDVGELVGHAVGFTIMSSGQNDFTNMEIFNTPKRALLVLGGYAGDRSAGALDQYYDEIKDMYTVGNHFKYIHVHDAQQDAGEDSAVFLSWLLAGKWVNALHGSNDPNDLKTNLEGIDLTIDRYNYFDQMLITDVGADPSVIEKCTVGGLDTAMGATGSTFSNIRAANTQHHLLAIRDTDGGGYGDMYHVDNCTNNLRSDEVLLDFDDSRMEYDKIGLRKDFPEELRVSKRVYPEAPEDLYFYDDFEASRELDTTKWMVEQGELEMHVGYGYLSEDPRIGRRSLPINADKNPDGIVVSRTFENDLNKVVEVKYLDRRKDYAGADRTDAVPTEILPNSFLRVDDGANALGIGAVGRVSKDYYQIMKGDELIQTNVKRYFGWHTFKFDYSSSTDVKLFIDDQLIAAYDESDGVATSFRYIGMGDWDGIGGKAFFDQLYVYGGKEAPAVEPLPELYNLPGKLEAEDYQTMSEVETEDCDDEDGGENITGIQAGGWLKYNVKAAKTGAYDVNWRVNVPAGKTAEFTITVDGEEKGTVNLASTNGQWQTLTSRMTLSGGLHKIVLTAKSADWKLNWMDFAFAGQEAPCRIEGEDFTDQYGIQVADVTPGGKCAGFIDDNDWMEYKLVIPEPGLYQINYRNAVNIAQGGVVEFFANGKSLAVTTLPNTGEWQNWDNVLETVEFEEAGTYTIRLAVNKGKWNLDWFEVKPEDSAQDVADQLTLTDPARGDYSLQKPEVPSGFSVAFEAVTPEGIIDKDWVIHAPEEDVAAEVTLLVTRTADQQTGRKTCTITVPSCSLEEIVEKLEIPQPENMAEYLTLPQVPYGFTLTIVSSTDHMIAADGKITWPLTEAKQVTVTARVTRLSDNSYKDKEFQFILKNTGKTWGDAIQADDIDAMKGTHIKVMNNEVYNFNPGDWIRYDNVDFGESDRISSIYIETAIAPSHEGKTIEVVLDDMDNGPVVGSLVVKSFGDWGVYGIQEAVLNRELSGYHTMYLRGVAGGNTPYEAVAGVKTVRLAAPSVPEEPVKYTVTVSGGDARGTIIPDKTEAKEGEEVTVSVSAGDGYYLVEDSLKANDEPIEGRKFTMPGMDVLITAVFEALPPMNYTVDIIPSANGTVTASPMAAAAGAQIALTVTPEDGYRMTEGSLSVTAQDGTSVEVTAENTFAMPDGNVTVTAAFERIPSDFSGLQEVYDQYKDLTQGNYTDDTWYTFMLRKTAAETVLNNPDAAQTEIDAARTALEEAFKGLTEKPSTGNVYRDLLQMTYDYAKDLSTEGVVGSAAKKFQNALAQAKTMLEDQQTADAQLEEAFDELLVSIWGLGLTRGDKTELEFLIAKADIMAGNKDNYVAAKWPLLVESLDEANAMMENGDAMTDEIRDVADKLLDAILQQRFKARKDILEGILNKASAVDESLYTEESVQVFRTAFAYAAQVMDDDTLSEDDQAIVDQAGEKLEKAILNLVKKDDTQKPEDPTTPEDPGTPEDPNTPQDPGTPEEPGTPEDPDTPSDENNQPSDDDTTEVPDNSVGSKDNGSAGQDGTVVSPKTGDYSNMGLALFMAILGIVCVGLVAARRSKKED